MKTYAIDFKFNPQTGFLCSVWCILDICLIQKDSETEISSLDSAEYSNNAPNLYIFVYL